MIRHKIATPWLMLLFGLFVTFGIIRPAFSACQSHEFDCKSAEHQSVCILSSLVNDGKIDCANGRDEGCPENSFICADNSSCIFAFQVKDGVTDCLDGSDEACSSDEFKCGGEDTICIANKRFQDGIKDCKDGSDEACLPSQHECICGFPRCIDKSFVKDGVADCLDKSDEVPVDPKTVSCQDLDIQELMAMERRKRKADYRYDDGRDLALPDGPSLQTPTAKLRTRRQNDGVPRFRMGQPAAPKSTGRSLNVDHNADNVGVDVHSRRHEHDDRRGAFPSVERLSRPEPLFRENQSEEDPNDDVGVASETTPEGPKRKTITLIGFVHFTTTVSDTEIVFMPRTMMDNGASKAISSHQPTTKSTTTIKTTTAIESTTTIEPSPSTVHNEVTLNGFTKTVELSSSSVDTVLPATTSHGENLWHTYVRDTSTKSVDDVTSSNVPSSSSPDLSSSLTSEMDVIPNSEHSSSTLYDETASWTPLSTDVVHTVSSSASDSLLPTSLQETDDPATTTTTTTATPKDDFVNMDDMLELPVGVTEPLPPIPPNSTDIILNRKTPVPGYDVTTDKDLEVDDVVDVIGDGDNVSPSVTDDYDDYPTGLVTSTEGSVISAGTTTHYTTLVIGTFIDDNYAQIVQSTSRLVFEVSTTKTTEGESAMRTTLFNEFDAVEASTNGRMDDESDLKSEGSHISTSTETSSDMNTDKNNDDGDKLFLERPVLIEDINNDTSHFGISSFSPMDLNDTMQISPVTNRNDNDFVAVAVVDPTPTAAPNATSDVNRDLTTVFATHTYFTTHFLNGSKSVESRREVVSSIMPKAYGGADIRTTETPSTSESSNNTDIDDGHDTSVINEKPLEVHNETSSSTKHGLLETIYSTVTYFTTFFLGGTTSTSSRIEIITHVLPETDVPSTTTTASIESSSSSSSSTTTLLSQTVTADNVTEVGLHVTINDTTSISISSDISPTTTTTTDKELMTIYTTYTFFTTFSSDGDTFVESREVVSTDIGHGIDSLASSQPSLTPELIVASSPLLVPSQGPGKGHDEGHGLLKFPDFSSFVLMSSMDMNAIETTSTSKMLPDATPSVSDFYLFSDVRSAFYDPVDVNGDNVKDVQSPTVTLLELLSSLSPSPTATTTSSSVPVVENYGIVNAFDELDLVTPSEQLPPIDDNDDVLFESKLGDHHIDDLDHDHDPDHDQDHDGIDTLPSVVEPKEIDVDDQQLSSPSMSPSPTLSERSARLIESSPSLLPLLTDTILDPSQAIEAAAVKTFFTTYTYYTTYFSNGQKTVSTSKETVSNVVTEPLPLLPSSMTTRAESSAAASSVTKQMSSIDDTKNRPTTSDRKQTNITPTKAVTYFTTYTYYTTFFSDGTPVVSTNRETVSNVVGSDDDVNIRPSLDASVRPTPQSTSPRNTRSSTKTAIDNVVTRTVTYYTTYTYFTTSYDGDETIINSNLETVSNIQTKTSTVTGSRLTNYNEFRDKTTSTKPPSKSLTTTSRTTAKSTNTRSTNTRTMDRVIEPTRTTPTTEMSSTSYPTGLISTTMDEVVDDGGTTTIYSTEVFGTFINGVYAHVVQSTSTVVNGDGEKATETSTSTAEYTVGLVSSVTSTHVSDDTTTVFTTKVIGTYIDGTYAQIVESTSTVFDDATTAVDEVQGAVSGSDVADVIDVLPTEHEPYKTGLISTQTSSTVGADGATTVFRSDIVGTYVDGTYAQIVQSTSTIVDTTPSDVDIDFNTDVSTESPIVTNLSSTEELGTSTSVEQGQDQVESEGQATTTSQQGEDSMDNMLKTISPLTPTETTTTSSSSLEPTSTPTSSLSTLSTTTTPTPTTTSSMIERRPMVTPGSGPRLKIRPFRGRQSGNNKFKKRPNNDELPTPEENLAPTSTLNGNNINGQKTSVRQSGSPGGRNGSPSAMNGARITPSSSPGGQKTRSLSGSPGSGTSTFRAGGSSPRLSTTGVRPSLMTSMTSAAATSRLPHASSVAGHQSGFSPMSTNGRFTSSRLPSRKTSPNGSSIPVSSLPMSLNNGETTGDDGSVTFQPTGSGADEDVLQSNPPTNSLMEDTTSPDGQTTGTGSGSGQSGSELTDLINPTPTVASTFPDDGLPSGSTGGDQDTTGATTGKPESDGGEIGGRKSGSRFRVPLRSNNRPSFVSRFHKNNAKPAATGNGNNESGGGLVTGEPQEVQFEESNQPEAEKKIPPSRNRFQKATKTQPQSQQATQSVATNSPPPPPDKSPQDDTDSTTSKPSASERLLRLRTQRRNRFLSKKPQDENTGEQQQRRRRRRRSTIVDAETFNEQSEAAYGAREYDYSRPSERYSSSGDVSSNNKRASDKKSTAASDIDYIARSTPQRTRNRNRGSSAAIGSAAVHADSQTTEENSVIRIDAKSRGSAKTIEKSVAASARISPSKTISASASAANRGRPTVAKSRQNGYATRSKNVAAASSRLASSLASSSSVPQSSVRGGRGLTAAARKTTSSPASSTSVERARITIRPTKTDTKTDRVSRTKTLSRGRQSPRRAAAILAANKRRSQATASDKDNQSVTTGAIKTRQRATEQQMTSTSESVTTTTTTTQLPQPTAAKTPVTVTHMLNTTKILPVYRGLRTEIRTITTTFPSEEVIQPSQYTVVPDEFGRADVAGKTVLHSFVTIDQETPSLTTVQEVVITSTLEELVTTTRGRVESSTRTVAFLSTLSQSVVVNTQQPEALAAIAHNPSMPLGSFILSQLLYNQFFPNQNPQQFPNPNVQKEHVTYSTSTYSYLTTVTVDSTSVFPIKFRDKIKVTTITESTVSTSTVTTVTTIPVTVTPSLNLNLLPALLNPMQQQQPQQQQQQASDPIQDQPSPEKPIPSLPPVPAPIPEKTVEEKTPSTMIITVYRSGIKPGEYNTFLSTTTVDHDHDHDQPSRVTRQKRQVHVTPTATEKMSETQLAVDNHNNDENNNDNNNNWYEDLTKIADGDNINEQNTAILYVGGVPADVIVTSEMHAFPVATDNLYKQDSYSASAVTLGNFQDDVQALPNNENIRRIRKNRNRNKNGQIEISKIFSNNNNNNDEDKDKGKDNVQLVDDDEEKDNAELVDDVNDVLMNADGHRHHQMRRNPSDFDGDETQLSETSHQFFQRIPGEDVASVPTPDTIKVKRRRLPKPNITDMSEGAEAVDEVDMHKSTTPQQRKVPKRRRKLTTTTPNPPPEVVMPDADVSDAHLLEPSIAPAALPVTYFTTFTYFTTVYDGTSTSYKTQEAVASRLTTEPLSADAVRAAQDELNGSATSIVNLGTRTKGYKTTVVTLGSSVRIEAGGGDVGGNGSGNIGNVGEPDVQDFSATPRNVPSLNTATPNSETEEILPVTFDVTEEATKEIADVQMMPPMPTPSPPKQIPDTSDATGTTEEREEVDIGKNDDSDVTHTVHTVFTYLYTFKNGDSTHYSNRQITTTSLVTGTEIPSLVQISGLKPSHDGKYLLEDDSKTVSIGYRVYEGMTTEVNMASQTLIELQTTSTSTLTSSSEVVLRPTETVSPITASSEPELQPESSSEPLPSTVHDVTVRPFGMRTQQQRHRQQVRLQSSRNEDDDAQTSPSGQASSSPTFQQFEETPSLQSSVSPTDDGQRSKMRIKVRNRVNGRLRNSYADRLANQNARIRDRQRAATSQTQTSTNTPSNVIMVTYTTTTLVPFLGDTSFRTLHIRTSSLRTLAESEMYLLTAPHLMSTEAPMTSSVILTSPSQTPSPSPTLMIAENDTAEVASSSIVIVQATEMPNATTTTDGYDHSSLADLFITMDETPTAIDNNATDEIQFNSTSQTTTTTTTTTLPTTTETMEDNDIETSAEPTTTESAVDKGALFEEEVVVKDLFNDDDYQHDAENDPSEAYNDDHSESIFENTELGSEAVYSTTQTAEDEEGQEEAFGAEVKDQEATTAEVQSEGLQKSSKHLESDTDSGNGTTTLDKAQELESESESKSKVSLEPSIKATTSSSHRTSSKHKSMESSSSSSKQRGSSTLNSRKSTMESRLRESTHPRSTLPRHSSLSTSKSRESTYRESMTSKSTMSTTGVASIHPTTTSTLQPVEDETAIVYNSKDEPDDKRQLLKTFYTTFTYFTTYLLDDSTSIDSTTEISSNVVTETMDPAAATAAIRQDQSTTDMMSQDLVTRTYYTTFTYFTTYLEGSRTTVTSSLDVVSNVVTETGSSMATSTSAVTSIDSTLGLQATSVGGGGDDVKRYYTTYTYYTTYLEGSETVVSSREETVTSTVTLTDRHGILPTSASSISDESTTINEESTTTRSSSPMTATEVTSSVVLEPQSINPSNQSQSQFEAQSAVAENNATSESNATTYKTAGNNTSAILNDDVVDNDSDATENVQNDNTKKPTLSSAAAEDTKSKFSIGPVLSGLAGLLLKSGLAFGSGSVNGVGTGVGTGGNIITPMAMPPLITTRNDTDRIYTTTNGNSIRRNPFGVQHVVGPHRAPLSNHNPLGLNNPHYMPMAGIRGGVNYNRPTIVSVRPTPLLFRTATTVPNMNMNVNLNTNSDKFTRIDGPLLHMPRPGIVIDIEHASQANQYHANGNLDPSLVLMSNNGNGNEDAADGFRPGLTEKGFTPMMDTLPLLHVQHTTVATESQPKPTTTTASSGVTKVTSTLQGQSTIFFSRRRPQKNSGAAGSAVGVVPTVTLVGGESDEMAFTRVPSVSSIVHGTVTTMSTYWMEQHQQQQQSVGIHSAMSDHVQGLESEPDPIAVNRLENVDIGGPVLLEPSTTTYYTTHTFYTTTFIDGAPIVKSREETSSEVVVLSAVPITATTLTDERGAVTRTLSILTMGAHDGDHGTIRRGDYADVGDAIAATTGGLRHKFITGDETNVQLIDEIKASASASAAPDVSEIRSTFHVADDMPNSVQHRFVQREEQTHFTVTHFYTEAAGQATPAIVDDGVTTVTEVVTLSPTTYTQLRAGPVTRTYFTTYSYYTTSFVDGSAVVNSRAETSSQVITLGAFSADANAIGVGDVATLATLTTMTDNTVTFTAIANHDIRTTTRTVGLSTSHGDESPIDVNPEPSPGYATYYTRYTYFTTYLRNGVSSVTSNIITYTQVVPQITRTILMNDYNGAGDVGLRPTAISHGQVGVITRLPEGRVSAYRVIDGTRTVLYVDNGATRTLLSTRVNGLRTTAIYAGGHGQENTRFTHVIKGDETTQQQLPPAVLTTTITETIAGGTTTLVKYITPTVTTVATVTTTVNEVGGGSHVDIVGLGSGHVTVGHGHTVSGHTTGHAGSGDVTFLQTSFYDEHTETFRGQDATVIGVLDNNDRTAAPAGTPPLKTEYITRIEATGRTVIGTRTTISFSDGIPETRMFPFTTTVPPRTLLITIIGGRRTVTRIIGPTIVQTDIQATKSTDYGTATHTSQDTTTLRPSPSETKQHYGVVTVDTSDLKPDYGGGDVGNYGTKKPTEDTHGAGHGHHEVTTVTSGLFGELEILSECKLQCDVSKNETCRFARGRWQCKCRPGEGRVDDTRICERVLTYDLSMNLIQRGDQQLVYTDKLRSVVTSEFEDLASLCSIGVQRAFATSRISQAYRGNDIISFVDAQTVNPYWRGVVVRVIMKVRESEYFDTRVITEELRSSLAKTNYSLGGTDLKVSQIPEGLRLQDLDECSSSEFNDCSPNATCTNAHGSFTCQCKNDTYDLDKDHPGRICGEASALCAFCNHQGDCVIDENGNSACKCYPYHLGSHCEFNWLPLAIILPILLGLLLLALLLWCCCRKGGCCGMGPCCRNAPCCGPGGWCSCCGKSRGKRGANVIVATNGGSAGGAGGGGGGGMFPRIGGSIEEGAGTLDKKAMITEDSASNSSGEQSRFAHIADAFGARATDTSKSLKLGKAHNGHGYNEGALSGFADVPPVVIPRAKHQHAKQYMSSSTENILKRGESSQKISAENKLIDILNGETQHERSLSINKDSSTFATLPSSGSRSQANRSGSDYRSTTVERSSRNNHKWSDNRMVSGASSAATAAGTRYAHGSGTDNYLRGSSSNVHQSSANTAGYGGGSGLHSVTGVHTGGKYSKARHVDDQTMSYSSVSQEESRMRESQIHESGSHAYRGGSEDATNFGAKSSSRGTRVKVGGMQAGSSGVRHHEVRRQYDARDNDESDIRYLERDSLNTYTAKGNSYGGGGGGGTHSRNQSSESYMKHMESSDSRDVVMDDDGDSSQYEPNAYGNYGTRTVSEVRSCDETTIHPATRTLGTGSYYSSSKGRSSRYTRTADESDRTDPEENVTDVSVSTMTVPNAQIYYNEDNSEFSESSDQSITVPGRHGGLVLSKDFYDSGTKGKGNVGAERYERQTYYNYERTETSTAFDDIKS